MGAARAREERRLLLARKIGGRETADRHVGKKIGKETGKEERKKERKKERYQHPHLIGTANG